AGRGAPRVGRRRDAVRLQRPATRAQPVDDRKAGRPAGRRRREQRHAHRGAAARSPDGDAVRAPAAGQRSPPHTVEPPLGRDRVAPDVARQGIEERMAAPDLTPEQQAEVAKANEEYQRGERVSELMSLLSNPTFRWRMANGIVQGSAYGP